MITVEIEIKQILSLTLDSREAASSLVDMLKAEEAGSKIVLDFSDIIFMSRSFADQFHKEIYSGEQPLDIMIKNADVSILDMLRAVSNTQNSRRKIKKNYQILSYNNLSQLEDFTFTW
jgi:GMP synthase PP-ATPase subunit